MWPRGVAGRRAAGAAQAAGAVPVKFNDWRPDFVVGTSLKYLCGGAGAAWLWADPETAAACEAEGAETLIPLLDLAIEKAAEQHVVFHDDRRAHAQDVPRRDPRQALGERLLIHQFPRLVERFFGARVLDQFDAHEAALGADVADDRMVVHFDEIDDAVLPPDKKALIQEVLVWYQKEHPIWFRWLQME